MLDNSSEDKQAASERPHGIREPGPPPAPAAIDFTRLSRAELQEALRSLLSAAAPGPGEIDPLQRVMHEMQVHRCELEMQNRALRDAQAELERSVRRYGELCDSLPVAYVTMTLHGRIVEANPAASELFGVERERLPGMYLRDLVSSTDGPALAAHLSACAHNAERQVTEATVERRRGGPVPVQVSSQRTETAEGIFVRTALTDVAELKEAQRVLRGMVAEQESFAYSISHDLRAPLLTISSFAKVLTEDADMLAPEEATDILRRIQRAACRMDELLQNLLEYSRVSRGPTSSEPVALDEVVKDMLVQHLAVIKERGARVSVQENLPSVLGSRALLGQVMSNLLTNALKYTPRERAPVVRIAAQETERAVLIVVADEGIGIPPQHRERIFGMFERLHGQHEYPGSGIGLALVHRAVERMRGRIWVESEEGKGSTFYVELPKSA